MSKELLRIEDLHAWYGESHILHGVNLTVNEGEVVTLLGRNGAGRTTTLRAIVGLTGSPACLVADEHDVSGNLARILKAAGQKAPNAQPILEINPKHPVVLRLKYEEAKFDDWAAVLFDQALLAEGGQLDDPATFVKRMNELMLSMSLGGK